MLDLVGGRHLVFDTALDRTEVARRLQAEIAPAVWQWYEQRPQLFEGRFDGERFSMVRLVRGKNSYRPVIEGHLLPGPRGTRVNVTLRAHPIISVFSGVLVLVAGLIVALLLNEWRRSGTIPVAALPLLGVFALAALGPFLIAMEARKATGMLEALFGVAASGPQNPSYR